jgi:hypothetical protein
VTRPAPRRPAAKPPPPAAGEDRALLARLREDARGARGRATDATAAPELIARGDSALGRAESLQAARRTAEAAVEYSAAAAVWGDAARAALARAEQARAAPTAPRPPAAPPTARPAVPPAPPPDPSPRIRALFDEYAAAVETRNVANIRQAYPGLQAEQAREWERFFLAVRDLEVKLQMTRLDVHGDTGEASLSGVYAFTDPGTNRTRRDTVSLLATLRRDARGWRIESLQ